MRFNASLSKKIARYIIAKPIEKRLYSGLSSKELLDLYKELMDASKDVK